MSNPTIPRLIGMVHLNPLPGAPGFTGSIGHVLDDAVTRARLLTEAGFEAVMVENFGDVPFFPDQVPPVTVAGVTAAVGAVARAVDARLGVNVLRNDALAALAVAAVTDADMIRVNVLTGSMDTDQGPIVGRAAEVARCRRQLVPTVAVWADVLVKHAIPPPGAVLERVAADTLERGGADALVVSGAATGDAPAGEDLRRLRRAFPDATLVVGSGARPDNLAQLAELADHVIVGTCLEEGGRPGAALDPQRLDRFAAVAEAIGWL